MCTHVCVFVLSKMCVRALTSFQGRPDASHLTRHISSRSPLLPPRSSTPSSPLLHYPPPSNSSPPSSPSPHPGFAPPCKKQGDERTKLSLLAQPAALFSFASTRTLTKPRFFSQLFTCTFHHPVEPECGSGRGLERWAGERGVGEAGKIAWYGCGHAGWR